MVKVLIIGFGYIDDEIPSTLFDIYQIYNRYSNIGYECTIITDINDFRYNRNVYESISFKKVDKEMLGFISELKKKPNYYNYIYDKKGLLYKLRSIEKENFVIVYYTGHASTDGIKLPSGEIFPFFDFKKELISLSKLEITILTDCCYASGMRLNYKLSKEGKGFFFEESKEENYPQKVIIIASSQYNEKSASIKHSSLFTKYFIEFLEQNESRLFVYMLDYINNNIYSYTTNKQQVNVYCSRIILPMIDTYLFSKNYIKIDIENKYIEIKNLE